MLNGHKHMHAFYKAAKPVNRNRQTQTATVFFSYISSQQVVFTLKPSACVAILQ